MSRYQGIPGLDNTIHDPLMPRELDDDTKRLAARAITTYALDEQDAGELMRMLGLAVAS